MVRVLPQGVRSMVAKNIRHIFLQDKRSGAVGSCHGALSVAAAAHHSRETSSLRRASA